MDVGDMTLMGLFLGLGALMLKVFTWAFDLLKTRSKKSTGNASPPPVDRTPSPMALKTVLDQNHQHLEEVKELMKNAIAKLQLLPAASEKINDIHKTTEMRDQEGRPMVYKGGMDAAIRELASSIREQNAENRTQNTTNLEILREVKDMRSDINRLDRDVGGE